MILFSLGPTFLFGETLSITLFRFLGATFLHALCSGVLGYFLALSFFSIWSNCLPKPVRLALSKLNKGELTSLFKANDLSWSVLAEEHKPVNLKQISLC